MLYIVTGLPRSGTSMLMKMLEAGGLEILTDHVRQPDSDNPMGYYEYEPVKKLAQDSAWVREAEGKGVKVISHLLRYLPKDVYYKSIFVIRPIEEVLASQKKMMANRNEVFDEKVQASLLRKFRDHLYSIRIWIAKQPHIDCLFVQYNDIVKNPEINASKVKIFLGLSVDAAAMASVVDSKLYRNKIDCQYI